jgi:DNA (cytosine-5)-methyltransferase 1
MFPESEWLGKSVNGDISKIPDSEFERFRGHVNLIFAGFPCQGFSHAGKKQADDPRNKMFYEFLRVVRIIQPEWIIGENVSGLLSRKTDDGNGKIIDVIKEEFSEIGYPLVTKICDVSKVEVPQNRKRLLMVGNRLGIGYRFPEMSYPKMGIRSILSLSLEGAVEYTLEQPDEDCIYDIPDMSPTGTPHPYLLRKLQDGQISFGKRVSPTHAQLMDITKPSNTIICAYSFQPRFYICLRTPNKKLYIRCMTVSELAQIQGFTSDFRFQGSHSSIVRQIGNAVPARLVELIVSEIVRSQTQE